MAVGSALLWAAAHGLRAHTDLSPWDAGNAAKAVSTVSASTVSFLFLSLFAFRPKEARVGVWPVPPVRAWWLISVALIALVSMSLILGGSVPPALRAAFTASLALWTTVFVCAAVGRW